MQNTSATPTYDTLVRELDTDPIITAAAHEHRVDVLILNSRSKLLLPNGQIDGAELMRRITATKLAKKKAKR